MKLKGYFVLSPLILAMGFQAHAQQALPLAVNEAIKTEQIERIMIVGVRQDRVSQGATGLTMEINETPQSISIVSAEQIKNYAANNLNDALKLAPGIGVEEWETNRSNYTSRGFEIKSTQIDGVGLPNNWGIVTGAMEAYGYEKVEVIRGANGLLTGVGNSSGTINYVRKRPTNENEGEVGLSLGSFNKQRLNADYSALLTESGSWAGRVVVAVEESDSHLDALSNDRSYIYGVVDGQLTDNSTITAGFSYQDANTDSNMWGGLVFNYTDGSQAEWDESATTTQEWAMWDTISTSGFIEYAYIFDNDWELNLTYNTQKFEDKSKLFYVYGSIDKETKLGLVGWPGKFESEFSSDIIDLTTIGKYSLFNRDHEVTFGLSRAKSNQMNYEYDYATTSAAGPTPSFPYAQDAIPEPVWRDKAKYSDIDVTLTRFFGSTKFNISESLFVIAGFNSIKYIREGINSGNDIDNSESEISPYAGITYAITDDVNAYVSYSDIYQPQEQYDLQGEFIDPTKGVNYEAGLKTQWFDHNLLATFAVFSAEQEDLATYAGTNPETAQFYYKGTNVKSKGFEVEIVGQITEQLNVLLAYTALSLEDFSGEDANEWAPRQTINFSIDYTLPQMSEFTFGVGGKWQSETLNTTYAVEQDAYLLLNTFARWEASEQLTVQANINNITDEKYINSLLNVGYYGAPVNATLGVTYLF
ncbi:TonB-dependent siderophore receptor [Colwellia sp. MB02u-9]|uniref:TonB-dependent siderophore receptor n=1 Tax=Colwellia sp. MB02u-9 TaxID=2759823 RepID=UPI0015F48623|nr:TonB-dependent siderophore receptor [Colwellia sp. MB02u-9]MBA6296671.1 TonB-dependent siderophore receptor [Colwellia sp. MB02u-9]